MLITILITNLLVLVGVLVIIYKLSRSPIAASTMDPVIKSGEVPTPNKEVTKKSPIYLNQRHSVNLAKRMLDREETL